MDELKASLRSIANLDKKYQMQKYMRNKFTFLGVQTPQRREIQKEFFKKFLEEVPTEIINKLWHQEEREFKYIALDLLKSKQKYLTYDNISWLKELIQIDSWWDTIDVMDKIIGDIGLRDNRVDELMLKWSVDDDFWIRRISIDHQLNRKSQTNKELLSKIIKNNFGSKEFFINKAIGWSLRQYSKTNPKWVSDFINDNIDKLDKLSIKEGLKHISTLEF